MRRLLAHFFGFSVGLKNASCASRARYLVVAVEGFLGCGAEGLGRIITQAVGAASFHFTSTVVIAVALASCVSAHVCFHFFLLLASRTSS